MTWYIRAMRQFLQDRILEIVALALPLLALIVHVFWPDIWPFLIVASIVGCLPFVLSLMRGFVERSLPADAFSLLAVLACGADGNWTGAALIACLGGIGSLAERHASDLARRGMERPTETSAPADATHLSIGDTITLNQGERAPVDGLVVRGTAHMDPSWLSGDARNVERLVGDPVMASWLVKAGRIKLRVTRTLQASSVERVREIWEQAEKYPAPVERLSERLAGFAMLALGLAGFAAWAFLKDNRMMISFFALASGAQLALPIHHLIRSRLASASRQGFVLKGGRFFEPLADLRALVIEKAGLLSHEDLHVGRLDHDPGISDAFVWECVAVAEKYSEHPAGRALFRTAAKHVGAMADPDEFHVFPSKGIRAALGGHEVMIGTAELLRARQISFESTWLAGSTSPIEGTGTDIFIALDGACIARVRIQNRPRTELGESLKLLRETGIEKQILLTGDSVQIAGAFAKGIGLQDFKPTVTSDEVWHEVGRLAQEGRVALLGDPMHHTQALRRADVGIVMTHGGQGLHVEPAGLILLRNDLTQLTNLIAIARQTQRLWKLLFLLWAIAVCVGVIGIFTAWLPPLAIALYAVLFRVPLTFAFHLSPVGQTGQVARK